MFQGEKSQIRERERETNIIRASTVKAVIIEKVIIMDIIEKRAKLMCLA